jgi:uncharacterized protein involved in exopolysaccharide biosynthesis
MSEGDQHSDEGERVLDPQVVIQLIVGKLKTYYRLLFALLSTFLIVAVVLAAVAEPQYVATAVVGPPQTSLSQSMLASGLSGSGLAGLASKLSGLGSLSGQGTPFSEYTQLLTSNRLAEELAQMKGVLPTVFYKKYDWENKRWKPRDDPFHRSIDFIKQVFHYPVKSSPDQDDLERFLSENMDVQTSLESEFVTVNLKFKDPAQAQDLLKGILTTADRIVRHDTRADVSARLAYLEKSLPSISQTDVKESLISILSTQQQTMMAISADKLFAFDLVDPAHADMKPVSPSLALFLFLAILLSTATWGVLVFVLRPDHWLLLKSNRSSENSLPVGNSPRMQQSKLNHR